MIESRAAIGHGDGTFSIETIRLGEPQRGEVVIAIKASGVCHTDWDSLRWGRRIVLGHEGAGEVLSTGEGVTTCKPGDRVMLNWAIPCGVCFQCERGKENICEDRGTVPDARFRHSDDAPLNASFSLGTMATHAIVPQAAVLQLPEAVPYEVAAIMGCAVMTGFGSAVNAAKVTEGSTVVVLGCGGVGLSTILGALHSRAARVIAIDVNPTRLQLATQFGATETLLANREDKGLLEAAKEVKRRTNGRGADYAFECTAVPELGTAPLSMIRSAGTAVGVSGIEQIVAVDMELFEWDKIYINPLYGACRPQRDFPLLIDLYLNHGLPLDALVTRQYPLDALEQAFQDMHDGINAKGVLVFD
ncbi:S-(hydroxymethyl)glutathione dehydrogenase/alcohol dehydrogenase [Granulicella aggregans]|uniref:S-(Hydroxymethyl)glutathione dehydrogenase/alcohol dehydrogenase n=1 Tax=Granulicella aggregans TaxID=474949 RepID=A0A7W8E1V3_9BACT|nr:alcohol dehydrogenase catalytic domain-containing protein [Granulicella aggregans]MBB5056238.1 S-(hydroxymethyl)glutathione dehydrogenase/alcohol dehydrogenase [Granulicella aggregans]